MLFYNDERVIWRCGKASTLTSAWGTPGSKKGCISTLISYCIEFSGIRSIIEFFLLKCSKLRSVCLISRFFFLPENSPQSFNKIRDPFNNKFKLKNNGSSSKMLLRGSSTTKSCFLNCYKFCINNVNIILSTILYWLDAKKSIPCAEYDLGMPKTLLFKVSFLQIPDFHQKYSLVFRSFWSWTWKSIFQYFADYTLR